MTQPEKMSAWRLASIALFCFMLGACSTTQKSSTTTGSVADEQPAAPVSEAGAASSDPSAPTAITAPSTTTPSTTAPDTQELPVFPESRATPIEIEEAEVARQQLAEQEAEITRLREEQAAAQQLADEEAAQRQEMEAAAAAQVQSGQTGTASSTPGTDIPPGAGAAAAPGTGASPGTGAAPGTRASPSATAAPDSSAIEQPAQRSVYFDYNDVAVIDEYDPVIAANAAFLKASSFTVVIQGNCDERGSREYNLALGARRAEMVRRALELSGVDGRRISTVSFGAEKPVALGKDEESYRLNRRADIVY